MATVSQVPTQMGCWCVQRAGGVINSTIRTNNGPFYVWTGPKIGSYPKEASMLDIQTVPLLDLKAQYETIRDEVRVAIDGVLDSQRFILGPEVEKLEHEIAAYSQCEFGIGVSSGTDALLVALMALGIGQGDEVITTPYTFFATAGVIARMGATPVFVDIESETYNIDPARLEPAITNRTRAIIPVHLYGQMADIDAIMKIAARHNLSVIEDAAQAIGSECMGRRAGSVGHMGCFSFFPSKNLGGFGDGGMVTTNDPDLAARLKSLRNHGFQEKYYNTMVGGNLRLDALQAAVLLVKLKYLDGWTQARQHNAELYAHAFIEAELATPPVPRHDIGPLPESMGIGLPVVLEGRRHIYNQYVIRSNDREALRVHLENRQVGTEVYYPLPLHQQPCFSNLGYVHGAFPISEAAAERTLALPIYPELTEQMIGYVVDSIAEFYEGRAD